MPLTGKVKIIQKEIEKFTIQFKLQKVILVV